MVANRAALPEDFLTWACLGDTLPLTGGNEDFNLVWKFEFGVSDLNSVSVWVIWIRCRCEWFEFGVSVSDLNSVSVWVIWIRCDWFEFGVSDLNSVWVIWIRCEWIKFGVHLWATVPKDLLSLVAKLVPKHSGVLVLNTEAQTNILFWPPRAR